MNPQPAQTGTSPLAEKVYLKGVLADTGVPANLSEALLEASGDQMLKEQIEEFRRRSLSDNTRRGYESDWKDFVAWCEGKGRASLPAEVETACLYFVDRSRELTKATLARRIAALSRIHRDAGFSSPTAEAKFRQVMAGVRRRKTEPQVAKRPLLATDLFEILAQLDDSTPQGVRDRALLVVGFTGALRRSEVVALDFTDVRWTREGIVLHLRTSKTDQEGQGTDVAIPRGRKPGTCPVRLLRAWVELAFN